MIPASLLRSVPSRRWCATTRALALLPVLAGLAAPAACGAAPAVQPAASIQDVMQLFVDPAADAIWDSVSSTTTSDGIADQAPRTDADWEAQRRHAVQVIEGANLLLVARRPVSDPGQPLEDARIAAVLTPAAIAARIDATRARFRERAAALQSAGLAALDAVRRRDADLLLQAGSALDAACERCHLDYWYPGGGPPPAPAQSRPR